MFYIFWGLLILSANYYTNYTPAFIGFALILIGVVKHKTDSNWFRAMILPSAVMIPIAAVYWVLHVIGATLDAGIFLVLIYPIFIIITSVALIVLCLQGITEQQHVYHINLQTERLKKIVIALIATTAIAIIGRILIYFFDLGYDWIQFMIGATLFSIGAFAMITLSILFIVQFYGIAKTINTCSEPKDTTPEPTPTDETNYVRQEDIDLSTGDYDEDE